MPMTRLYLGLVVSSSTSTDAPLLLPFLHMTDNISHSTLHIHYCLSSCMQVSLHGYHGYINREKKINCTIYTKTRAIDKASMVAVYIQLYAFKQAPAHVDGHSCFLIVNYPVICFFLITTTLAFTTSPGMMSAKAVEPYVGGR